MAVGQHGLWWWGARSAVLPEIPHSNSCERVPNPPLRPRRGRFGTLLQQLECGIFGRTAVAGREKVHFHGMPDRINTCLASEIGQSQFWIGRDEENGAILVSILQCILVITSTNTRDLCETKPKLAYIICALGNELRRQMLFKSHGFWSGPPLAVPNLVVRGLVVWDSSAPYPTM